MSCIVIFGDDKIGRRAASRILREQPSVTAYFDRSTNTNRIWKLFKRRALLPGDLLRMGIAELLRSNVTGPSLTGIATNAALLQAIQQTGCRRVYLFRAGLIVNQSVLSAGVDILNIHCASLPDFGGLASIPRALRAGRYEQCATLHHVEATIDTGEVLATEPYELRADWPYRCNEDVAYDAGIRLLLRRLQGESLLPQRKAS